MGDRGSPPSPAAPWPLVETLQPGGSVDGAAGRAEEGEGSGDPAASCLKRENRHDSATAAYQLTIPGDGVTPAGPPVSHDGVVPAARGAEVPDEALPEVEPHPQLQAVALRGRAAARGWCQ